MNVPGWLELFLRTFPAEFREAHRRELEEFVSLELSQAGRRWPWVALRMGLDLARTGLSLRLRPVRRGIWAALKNDGGEGWMMSGLGDLKLAVRGLGRSRGFSAVVVLTLALGVGLNTALFSVVNAVLLRPLDYDRPDRLVYVEARLQTPDVSVTLSGGDLRDLRTGVGALENVEGIALIRQNLNGAGLPRQADVGWVSAGFLAMLGVEPALGRVHHEDDPEGRVVVSHDLWKDAFGSDPEALGKTVQLDGYPYVVIGVLPSDFRLHLPAHGGGAQIQPEVWKNPDSFWQNGDIWAAQGPEFGLLRILGRLGEGAAVADAQNGVDAVTLDLRSRYSAYETEDLAMNVAVLQERVVEEGVQVFQTDGTFVRELIVAPATRGGGSTWDIAFSKDPEQKFIYLADGMNKKVYIIERETMEVLTSFGDGGRQPGQFFGVHSIATDSQGNIYTTETYEGKRIQKFVYKGLGPVTAENQGVVWPRN